MVSKKGSKVTLKKSESEEVHHDKNDERKESSNSKSNAKRSRKITNSTSPAQNTRSSSKKEKFIEDISEIEPTKKKTKTPSKKPKEARTPKRSSTKSKSTKKTDVFEEVNVVTESSVVDGSVTPSRQKEDNMESDSPYNLAGTFFMSPETSPSSITKDKQTTHKKSTPRKKSTKITKDTSPKNLETIEPFMDTIAKSPIQIVVEEPKEDVTKHLAENANIDIHDKDLENNDFVENNNIYEEKIPTKVNLSPKHFNDNNQLKAGSNIFETESMDYNDSNTLFTRKRLHSSEIKDGKISRRSALDFLTLQPESNYIPMTPDGFKSPNRILPNHSPRAPSFFGSLSTNRNPLDRFSSINNLGQTPKPFQFIGAPIPNSVYRPSVVQRRLRTYFGTGAGIKKPQFSTPARASPKIINIKELHPISPTEDERSKRRKYTIGESNVRNMEFSGVDKQKQSFNNNIAQSTKLVLDLINETAPLPSTLLPKPKNPPILNSIPSKTILTKEKGLIMNEFQKKKDELIRDTIENSVSMQAERILGKGKRSFDEVAQDNSDQFKKVTFPKIDENIISKSNKTMDLEEPVKNTESVIKRIGFGLFDDDDENEEEEEMDKIDNMDGNKQSDSDKKPEFSFSKKVLEESSSIISKDLKESKLKNIEKQKEINITNNKFNFNFTPVVDDQKKKEEASSFSSASFTGFGADKIEEPSKTTSSMFNFSTANINKKEDTGKNDIEDGFKFSNALPINFINSSNNIFEPLSDFTFRPADIISI